MRPLYIEGYCYFPLWLLVLIKKLAETFMSSQVSGNEVKLEWFLKWLVTHNLNFQYVIKTKLISSENQMQNTPCVVDSFKVGYSWLDMRVDSIQSVPIQTDGAPFSSWVNCGVLFSNDLIWLYERY